MPADRLAAEVADFLSALRVMPVFTAHPTESRRRTVLELLAYLGDLVSQRDDGPSTAEEQAAREQQLLAAITLLWQTEEVRPRRPTVLDEVAAVLAIVGPSLFAVVPGLQAELRRAFERRFPGESLPEVPFLEPHSWVGGDRDGNPNVTAEVTRQTMERHRSLALTGYIRRTERLAHDLSVASTRATPSDALTASLASDADELPDTADELNRRAPSSRTARSSGSSPSACAGPERRRGTSPGRRPAPTPRRPTCSPICGWSRRAYGRRMAAVSPMVRSLTW